MVRKQVYIEQRQHVLLKRMAKILRVPESVIIRQGIDQALQGGPEFHPTPSAIERERRYLRSLLRERRYKFLPWTREEIHER